MKSSIDNSFDLSCYDVKKYFSVMSPTVTIIILFLGVNNISLLHKAKGMQNEVQAFLRNYKLSASMKLPKVGDSIFTEYVDTTKGISEEARDELTSYLSTFDEINMSVLDIPSMIHDTIAFIIHHSSDGKGITVYI